MSKMKVLVAIVGAMISMNAFADGRTEALELTFNDTTQSVIPLKRELIQQHGISQDELDRSTLVSVRVMAKSQFGGGQATLATGQDMSDPQRIYGTPEGWDRRRPGTFDHLTFFPRSRTTEGRWQLHLNGNTKVRRVTVELRRRRQHRPPHQISLRCESHRRHQESCYVAGHIVNVSMIRQLSHSPCVYGRSWGFTRDSVWVKDGCRADFSVSVSNGRGDGGRFEEPVLPFPRGGNGGHGGGSGLPSGGGRGGQGGGHR